MAFQQGLSGLSSASTNLDVISRNIANANTVGYKGGQAQFADVFAHSSGGGGGGVEVGIGTRVLAVAKQFSQGQITPTNNPLDVAINGEGFFKLNDGGSYSFTRNGQFHLDKDGYLNSNTDTRLRGYTSSLLDATGNITGFEGEGDVQVNFSPIPAVPTDEVRIGLNLDERSSIPSVAFPTTSVPSTGINANSYNHSTTVSVTDSSGDKHDLTLYFAKSTANTWDVYATADSADYGDPIYDVGQVTFAGDGSLSTPANGLLTISSVDVDTRAAVSRVTGLIAGNLSQTGSTITVSGTQTTYSGGEVTIANGTLVTLAGNASNSGTLKIAGGTVVFDSATGIATVTGGTVIPGGTTSIPLSKDVDALSINLTLKDPGNAAPLLTQYASDFGVHLVNVNGQASGSLTSLSVGVDGTINAQYSNGQSKPIAQLMLVNFRNPDGLVSLGSNQWGQTDESGAEIPNKPGEGIAGVLQSGSVENSNVDLTSELVNLIIAQRMYQANSQSVKTQSDLLQVLVNMG
ncbi:MAG: flagellar hook protein FlgE [Betaproteobacteria bacterium]|nr:flagellar hook protein FlgE [Betaproteobacteria bacterium]